MVPNLVSVAKLLSTCIDANHKGCEVIRDFHTKSSVVSGTLKDIGDIRSVVTQADLDAQNIVVGSLRHVWGTGLRIVGEEDDDTTTQTSLDGFITPSLRMNLLDLSEEEDDFQVPLDELTVFVDPVDGTREFVEGRLGNVGCLIGIARNGRAVGGAVGLPFPGGDIAGDVPVHYALLQDENEALSGTFIGDTSASTKGSSDDVSDSQITVLTGDSSDPILRNATECALSIATSISGEEASSSQEPNHKILGGTAAKLVSVAMGQNTMAILHFKTCLWDTCATEALIHAKGGKVTDLFGCPLSHAHTRSEDNVFGVVASSGEEHMARIHDELCAKMRADTKSVNTIFGKWMGNVDYKSIPQAVDLARDLDGLPLGLSWLEQHIRGDDDDDNLSLKGYSVPESGAWRGMMSNGCRVMLNWEKQNNNTTPPPPSSAFYKRVVMSDLSHARAKLRNAPHKLTRDVKSYQVETAFLTSDACQNGLRNEAGVRVNRVYGADLRPAKDGSGPAEQIESRFSILLEDFSKEDGWKQEWLLEERSARASLEALAKMHGYFWHGSNFWKREGGKMGKELEDAVWPNGGYMQPALQGREQLEKVEEGWTRRLPSFEDDLRNLKELEGVDISKLGERLQKIATFVGDRAHPFWDSSSITTSDLQKYRTIIHGDPKQANIFFRETDDDSSEELEVGLIDFQWSGFGLAATDVAHHISAALQPNCLSYDGAKEKQLLDWYYSCLSKSLVENGVASSELEVQNEIYPRSVLQEQYEIAFLDICRMVFAYAWARWKPESKPTAASLNRNAYNKSLPNVLWLIVKCSDLLSVWEEN